MLKFLAFDCSSSKLFFSNCALGFSINGWANINFVPGKLRFARLIILSKYKPRALLSSPN